MTVDTKYELSSGQKPLDFSIDCLDCLFRLYCIVLYCIVLYCIALYCIVLYCIALHCIALYCDDGRRSQWHFL